MVVVQSKDNTRWFSGKLKYETADEIAIVVEREGKQVTKIVDTLNYKILNNEKEHSDE